MAVDREDLLDVQLPVPAAAELFLVNHLITIDWSVQEVEIYDRYDVVLTASYATEVPVAVIVLEPASVSLPNLRRGAVFHGELIATNDGLIRADDVRFVPPRSNGRLRYEFLASVPEALLPTQRVRLPFRVTALTDVGEGAASGGGCDPAESACIGGESECANGEVITTGSCTVFVTGRRSCTEGDAFGEVCCPPWSGGCGTRCAQPGNSGVPRPISEQFCGTDCFICCGAGGGGPGHGGGPGGGGGSGDGGGDDAGG